MRRLRIQHLVCAAGVALAPCWLAPAPAAAGTLPPSDLRAGEATLSVGLPFVAYDQALDDHWSIGAAAAYYYAILDTFKFAALRTSYHAARGDHLTVGFSLAAGVFDVPASPNMFNSSLISPGETSAWLLPTLDLTLNALPLEVFPNLILRASVGPPLVRRFRGAATLPSPVAGSAELMVRVSRRLEVGVGLPDLLGVRYVW